MSWLSALTLVPLFAGAAVLLGRLDNYARRLCGVAALLVAAVSLYVFLSASANSAQLQFREFRTLFGSAAIGWNLAVDGWGLVLQLLTAVLVAAAAWTADDEVEGGSAWILTIGGAALGAILSFNLLLTLLFLALLVFCIAFAALEALGPSDRGSVGVWLGSAASGWLLLLAAAVLLGSDTGKAGVVSFNYPSLLRLTLDMEAGNLRFALVIAGSFALAGLWPFGGGRASLARRLPSSLAAVTFLLPPLVALLFLARFGLPLFPKSVVAFAPWLYASALTAAIYAAGQCLAKPALRTQLLYAPAVLAGTTMAAMLVLDAGSASSALLLLANGLLALALLWQVLGWLNKNGPIDPDAWTLANAVAERPWLLALTFAAFWAWGALPASGGFSAHLLMLFTTLDRALAGYNKGDDFGVIYTALALAIPTLLIACHAGLALFAMRGQNGGEASAVFGVSARQKAALALLASALAVLALQPTWLLSRSEAAVQFTYERRLLGSDALRAPSYEGPLEPEPDPADLPPDPEN